MSRHEPKDSGFPLVAPAGFALLFLFVLPLAAIAVLSFFSRGPYGEIVPSLGLGNWFRLADASLIKVFARSLELAFYTTALCVLVGYPLAIGLDTFSGRWQVLATAIVVLPSWMNVLVKNYAWIVLLRQEGVFNTLFGWLGLVDAPLPLLYNKGAVLIGLVHTQLPFMVLPLLAALHRLDRAQVDAARDLGAGPWQVFRHVILPGTRRGLMAGSVFVFVASLGSFVTPDLLGGTSATMIGNLMQIQVLEARDWPFASAMAWSLAMIVLVVAVGMQRLGADGREDEA